MKGFLNRCAVVLFILIGSFVDVKAGVVPLSVDYTAEASVHVDFCGYSSQNYTVGYNQPASASAIVSVPKNESLGIEWDTGLVADADFSVYDNSNGDFSFRSDLDVGGGDDFAWGEASAQTAVQGSIAIGANAVFSSGSPLSLVIAINKQFPSMMGGEFYYTVKLWSDNPEQPLFYTYQGLDDDAEKVFAVNINAGDVLDFEIVHYDDGYAGHSFRNHIYFDTSFTVVPEPATILLFGLGGIILRSKKAKGKR
ncbi:MAG: PEP-CTERM sorting domain-containing protein [Sedimentisphaerales bacterium]|nr:PEP-CTERM sorting domain-containing protein [Sedimentisphaerales bacterium]